MSEPIPCQRWKERRPRYRPSGERIRTADYAVDGIAHDRIAREFVEKHHYSGSFVAARLRVGLYRRGPLGHVLVGVAVFSEPVQPASLVKWCGTKHRSEGIELGRLVLLDDVPGNGESWFMARAFALLRREDPAVRRVLSYSDPLPRRTSSGRLLTPGHVGIVYQALNGRYHGQAEPRTILLDGEGRTVSARAISKIRAHERGNVAAAARLIAAGADPRRTGEEPSAWLDRVLNAPPFVRVKHPGNHVYEFVMSGEPSDVPILPYPRKPPTLETA